MRAVRRLIVLAVAAILCLAHHANASLAGIDYDWVVLLDDSDNGTDILERTLQRAEVDGSGLEARGLTAQRA
jgi:hypothetical protein